MALMIALVTLGVRSREQDRSDPAIARQLDAQGDAVRAYMAEAFEPQESAGFIARGERIARGGGESIGCSREERYSESSRATSVTGLTDMAATVAPPWWALPRATRKGS